MFLRGHSYNSLTALRAPYNRRSGDGEHHVIQGRLRRGGRSGGKLSAFCTKGELYDQRGIFLNFIKTGCLYC